MAKIRDLSKLCNRLPGNTNDQSTLDPNIQKELNLDSDQYANLVKLVSSLDSKEIDNTNKILMNTMMISLLKELFNNPAKIARSPLASSMQAIRNLFDMVRLSQNRSTQNIAISFTHVDLEQFRGVK